MANFIHKVFSSKVTTVALIVGLAAAGAAAFGGVNFSRNTKSASHATVAAATKSDEAGQASASDEAKSAEISSADQSTPKGSGDAMKAPPAIADPPDEDAEASPANAESAQAAADPASDDPAPAPARTATVAPPDPIRIAAAADAGGANSFNRLLKRPASAPNAPPARDGIHDPANPGTSLLQWPSVAFADLPKTSDGNKVDWVKALEEGDIKPRYVLNDPKADPFVLDLTIVRQVKGSMPNVVYPHKQHTEWLDCSNCHDEIFIPQKGANQISMAGILLGQKCGVCHGKVAFPVSDCRRCHSQPKTEEELRALADRSSWANDGGK